MSLKREEHEDEREAMRLLSLVGLESQAQEPADALSFGQQKLLAIARLLAGQPQTLLLDEPAAGVNPSILTTILDLLRALATEGRAVVLIEHDMEVVLKAADWVFFMAEGRIEAFGLPQEVISDPSIRLRFLGR
jgi:ABC-type branched-subunit amino acid transport system ATPase component